MITESIPPTIDNLREQIAEHKYNTMSESRKREIVGEVIWADVRSEGVPIKLLGETFAGASPYMIHEEDDWLTIMYDTGFKGRLTKCRLNIWLDDMTHQWKWAIYEPDRTLAIASGDAEPIVDYEGH